MRSLCKLTLGVIWSLWGRVFGGLLWDQRGFGGLVGSAWFWVVLWDQLCDPAGSSVIEYFYSFLCAFVIIFIFLLRESPKVCVNFWLRIFSMLILRADLGCFSRCLCVCLSVRWTERTDIGSRLNY